MIVVRKPLTTHWASVQSSASFSKTGPQANFYAVNRGGNLVTAGKNNETLNQCQVSQIENDLTMIGRNFKDEFYGRGIL